MVSARTFQVCRISEAVSLATWASAPSTFSDSPMAKLVPIAGTVPTGPPRVPAKASVRPSVPLFITITAIAPAVLRVDDLVREGAGATLDQGDVALGELGEVSGLAAAGGAAGSTEIEVDRLHGARHVAEPE